MCAEPGSAPGIEPPGAEWYAKRERHREPCLARVEHEMRGYAHQKDPETVVRSALRLLSRHVSEGKVEQVRQLLRAEIRELWP